MKCFYSSIKILIYVGIVMILFSCKKEIVYEGSEGTLKGKVILYGTSITDYSGVKVTIDGSSPVLKTITNEKGEYSVDGLKTGIYDIVFTKEGYGTYKMVSFQFIAGNVPVFISPITFYKIPDVDIADLKVDTSRYTPYHYEILVKGALSASSSDCFRYYVSDNKNISYANYQATDIVFTYGAESLLFYPSSTLLSKFSKGKQLYIIVYPSAYPNLSYIDITTGKLIYNVNTSRASAAVPFMIPNTIAY